MYRTNQLIEVATAHRRHINEHGTDNGYCDDSLRLKVIGPDGAETNWLRS